MNRCETCRFMAGPRPITAYLEEGDKESAHRTCVRVIHGNGDAQHVTGTQVEPALVVDGSGYAACLIVLPTFGCVLHEPSEGLPSSEPVNAGSQRTTEKK